MKPPDELILIDTARCALCGASYDVPVAQILFDDHFVCSGCRQQDQPLPSAGRVLYDALMARMPHDAILEWSTLPSAIQAAYEAAAAVVADNPRLTRLTPDELDFWRKLRLCDHCKRARPDVMRIQFRLDKSIKDLCPECRHPLQGQYINYDRLVAMLSDPTKCPF